MDTEIWVLDEDEDNRLLALELLARAGADGVMGFASADALLAHAARTTPPRAAIIDAASATGREHDLARAVGGDPLILTTWPRQEARWVALGATRFLLKPYTLDCFVARAVRRPCGPGDPTGRRAT